MAVHDIAAVGRAEHLVGRREQHARVVRREHERRVPVPAVRAGSPGRRAAGRMDIDSPVTRSPRIMLPSCDSL